MVVDLSTAQLAQVVAPKAKQSSPDSESHCMMRAAGNRRDPAKNICYGLGTQTAACTASGSSPYLSQGGSLDGDSSDIR